MAAPESEVVITARYEDRASEGIQRLAADLGSLSSGTEALTGIEAGMSRTLEAAQSFRAQYVEAMGSMSDEVRDSLEGLAQGGYMALARALAMMVSSGTFASKEFGKAMLQMSAMAVLAIGRQAAVKAVFALAEGLLFKDPTALAAAKLYGAVAAMAMAVGASMMGAASKMSSGEQSGGGGYGSRSAGRNLPSYGALPQEQPQPGIVVNVHVQGHVVDTRAFVEEHVAPALADAVGRGVAARGQYNLIVERD